MISHKNFTSMFQIFVWLFFASSTISAQDIPDQTETSTVIRDDEKIPTLQDHCIKKENFCSAEEVQDEVSHCHCDDECIDYNDCCHDFNFTKTRPTVYDQQKCFPKVYEIMPVIRFGFFAVDSCPKAYKNSNIITKCLADNISDNGIFVVHGKRLVFKNRFCAICNGISDFESFRIQFYDIRFDHPNFDEDFLQFSRQQKFEYLVKNSNYLIHPPENARFRSCVPRLVTNNNSLCNAYIQPVLIKDSVDTVIYRNSFCLPRHIAEDHTKVMCVNKNHFTRTVSMYSLSILFAFDIRDNSCEETRYGCELYSNLEKDIQLFWYSEIRIPGDLLQKIVDFSVWFFTGNDNFETKNNNFFQIDFTHKVIKLEMKITFKKSLLLSEIDHLMETIKHRSVTLLVEDSPSNIYRVELLPFIPLQLDSLNFTTPKMFGITEEESYLKLKLERTFNINKGDSTPEILCQNLSLKTTFINGSLYIEETSCYDKHSKNDKILPNVLTYVCFSLSVIALITVLIIQRRKGLIDNPSSSNVENMSFAMLLSNLLFMVGIGLQKVAYLCYFIGVFLHFLWLSVFSFTTVSVIYIAKTLTQVKSRKIVRYEYTRRLRIKLTLVGFTLPLTLVISTVGLDNFGPPSLSAGYGSNACFPNNYPINVIFFTGPVLLSVLFNLACLCYMFGKICQVRLEAANIKRLSPYKDAIVYFRIVIVSGISWLSAFLPIFLDNEISELVFIILCGLHGLFLSVAVLTSSRVRSSMTSSSRLSSSREERSASTRF